MTDARAIAACERKFAASAIGRVGEDGTFSGYASLFGKADLANDVVEPGAFSRAVSLQVRQRTRSSAVLQTWKIVASQLMTRFGATQFASSRTN